MDKVKILYLRLVRLAIDSTERYTHQYRRPRGRGEAYMRLGKDKVKSINLVV